MLTIQSYLAALAGVDTVVFTTGSVPADDAHVLSIGQGVRGRVGGGRGASREASDQRC